MVKQQEFLEAASSGSYYEKFACMCGMCYLAEKWRKGGIPALRAEMEAGYEAMSSRMIKETEDMVLETERLHIRYITERDWQSIKEIWDDFSSSEYAQYDRPNSTDEADVRARIAKWEKANSGTEHMFFAICLDDIVIGYIAFNKREDGYEIGYCFHSDYHGKGYAKESHLALIDYLQSLGITRFTAGTALKNLPSVKLLKSLGFRQIGEEKVSFYKDPEGKDIFFDGGIFEL